MFTKNRDRLLEGAVAEEFFTLLVNQVRRKRLLSDEHFTVDGTLVEAWAGQKSFQRKAGGDKNLPPQGPGGNPTVNYHREKRSNATHESLTDRFARLTIDRKRKIHLILDNYGTHKHPAVKQWFALHPRYQVHFTPTGASWLNQIERWFAEITSKRIRRGTFGSVKELERAIHSYIRSKNHESKPFVWTATAADILRKLKKCKETSETGH